jgi:5-methylcytosine-specific restriction endonuclease McrA
MLIDTTCQTCGATFQVSPSRFKHGRGKSCSPACQHAAVARKLQMRVTLTCHGCGCEYARAPSHAASDSGKGKYCSRHCRDTHRIRGLHPQYLGGPDDYRGPNWQSQKRKAKSRDNRTCQHCQSVGSDVHHIRPFRLFSDYLEANNLSNLITLCRPCHRVADAEFQASERG